MVHTFVLSDDSVNSKGFITKTEGIELSRFEQNPVMLYNHDPSVVLGKWVNIRKEDGKLLADAEFDLEDEFVKKIENKVKKGYLKGVSIGAHIDPSSVSLNEDHTPVIGKATLFEASLCSLPSNSSAVKLYDQNRIALSDKEEEALHLQLTSQNKNIMESTLKNNVLLSALEVSDISEAQSRIKVLLDSETELMQIKATLEQQQDEQIEALLLEAIEDKKINLQEKQTYKELAEKDFSLFQSVLKKLTAEVKLSDVPSDSKDTKPALLSFDQWRKQDPIGLLKFKAEDPQGYQTLIDKN